MKVEGVVSAVEANADEKQKIKFAWPELFSNSKCNNNNFILYMMLTSFFLLLI